MMPNLQPLIFVVDDDMFYLKLIEQNLKSASYTRLLTFTSGEECVNNLHLMPDIILLDYNLHDSNGIEVLKNIKLYNQDAYVFFLSAQEEIDIAINSIKHGAFGYVVKDEFAFSNILEEINGVVNYQAENKPATTRMIGLKDYLAQREQNERILTYKNEQLTKVNTELDKFVYCTSHDLRGPLTSMLGLIKLAQMEADDLKRNALMELMEKTVNKLDSTVKDIMNYSVNNRSEIKTEEVHLNALAKEVIENLNSLEKASGIEKNILIRQHAPFLSDAGRIKIILTNLISNAIKYHDFTKEQPFINLTIEVDTDQTTISLTDNGCGINEAYIRKVFDMFSRGTIKSNGSGLGLYIVKEVMDKLKGTIEVTSKLGEGTTFHLQLPNYSKQAVSVSF